MQNLFDQCITLRFTYGGETFHGETLGQRWRHPDGLLELTVQVKEYPEHGAREYTAWFTNVGDRPTAPLEEIYAADLVFPAERCRSPWLKGILGDHDHQYRPYALRPAGIGFTNTRGRATHTWFPYFNLECEGGGWMLALGWPGTWRADFSMEEGAVRYRAQGCVGFRACLQPGETVRTPLTAFLRYDYEARDEDVAYNAWRRWMLDCCLPTREPISVSCLSGDTGRPNSDGSISETHETWRPTFDKIQNEGLRLDYRWIDAGWYYGPAGQSLDGLSGDNEWWRTGSLALDKAKWPGGTLRECTDAMRAYGTKTLLWFEPERVCAQNIDDLERNFGLQRDWLLPNGGDTYLANLGAPDCYAWTLGRILSVMDENGIDMYREDFNCDPASAWEYGDRSRELKIGLPSRGLTENLHVQGHLRLWDDILAYCAQTGKTRFVDSCASGGGRNDLESLRRGVPLMRSDADRTTIALRLSMSSSFLRWVPFHGASNGERAGELDSTTHLDLYEARGSCLPVFHCHFQFQHPGVPYDVIRQAIAEWERISPWFDKDFYLLTDWHDKTRTDQWTAWMFFDPAKEDGIVQAFRQETAPNAVQTLRLRGLDPAKSYRLADFDGLRSADHVSGRQLMEGWAFTLEQPRSAGVFKIMLV
ncbi:MAG: GH36 C-terminal domain-containing protein [Oscillospiraceae bacterium]|nr:GH36 C-terminal domain-containing protein [Oscillospiraceae bacterium]